MFGQRESETRGGGGWGEIALLFPSDPGGREREFLVGWGIRKIVPCQDWVHAGQWGGRGVEEAIEELGKEVGG